jgi:3-deoxy-D-manno-octulosonate 8-phosphate phosphatase (KDO 8-P phosphatase)
MSKTRARKIKVLLFDVDGVMTDGKLWIFPAPAGAQQSTSGHAEQMAGHGGYALASATMIEAKGFHAHDGTAISLARMGGVKTGLITKRISETVALRARDLKLEYVYQGVMVKVRVFEEILAREKITAAAVAYIGDDVIDLPVMRRCGFAIAVANARDEVKKEAHWVTPHAGGEGAIRDAVEYILRAQGSWGSVVKQYLERGDAKPGS